MTDHMLDRELRDLLTAAPRRAPAATVDRGIDQARAVAQRRPTFSRLDRRAWPPPARSLADPGVHRSARLLLVMAVLALLVVAVVAVGSRVLDDRPVVPASLVSAGSLDVTVRGPRLTALPEGRLLILGQGGYDQVAMYFDPSTGDPSGGVSFGEPFVTSPASYALPDGRVLLIGSLQGGAVTDGRSAVGWLDPTTGSVTVAGTMLAHRFAAAPAVLPDGRVLVSGDADFVSPVSETLASVEVLVPDGGAFGPVAPMLQPRLRHWMLVLDDGRVLVVGGQGPGGVGPDGDVLDVELYDPEAGGSSVVGTIGPGRGLQAGPPLRLSDGRVLIPGGPVAVERCGESRVAQQAMYRFDPRTQELAPLAPLPHFVGNAVALADGRVLVFGNYLTYPGGCETGVEPVLSPWLGVYNPETGITLETRNPTTGIGSLSVEVSRQYESGALLPDGRVALIADDSDNPTPNAVDIFTPGR